MVGDGVVGGAAQVRVGDEAGAEAVGAVAACFDAGAVNGVAYQRVHRFGMESAVQGVVAFGDGSEDGSGGDVGGVEPGAQGGDGATHWIDAVGDDDQFWLCTSLIRLGPADGGDQAAGVLVEVVDVEGGEFAAA